MTPEPSPPRRRPRWPIWVLLCAGLALTVVRTAGWVEENWPHRGKQMLFFDFSVHTQEVNRLESQGILYDTQRPGYFEPSSAVYKYPPTFAAVLRATNGLRPLRAMKIALWVEWGLLLGSLACLLVQFRPTPVRAALFALLFVNWQPFWESIAGIQLEPMMLLLLCGALLFVRRERPFAAGVAVGAAAAWKVYPIALLGYFALRRQWRAFFGALAGFAATVVLTFIAIHPRYWLQFFTEILPKVGGASLWYSNLALFGVLGRLAVWLLAGPARVHEFGTDIRPLLDGTGIPGVEPLALALVGITTTALLVASVAAYRRSRGAPAPARQSLAFGASICLMLLLLPTAWADYQVFLILTLAAILFNAPAPPRARLMWVSLISAVACIILIDGNSAFFADHLAICSLARTLACLLLWLAALLLLRRPASDWAPCGASVIPAGASAARCGASTTP